MRGKPSRCQRGTALVVVLGWSTLLLPLVAWIWLQARMDQILAQNFRRDLDSYYVAEAGLHFALATFQHCSAPDCALAGPDGRAGTADDGGVTSQPGAWIPYGDSSAAFQVQLSPMSATQLRLRARSRGWGASSAELEAIVTWSGAAVRVTSIEVLDQ